MREVGVYIGLIARSADLDPGVKPDFNRVDELVPGVGDEFRVSKVTGLSGRDGDGLGRVCSRLRLGSHSRREGERLTFTSFAHDKPWDRGVFV